MCFSPLADLILFLFLTLGSYLGASFDVPSLVDKLLEQLASKQKIVVKLYDTTNHTSPIKMYGSDFSSSGDLQRISNIDFGDPTRKHEMHCRYKSFCDQNLYNTFALQMRSVLPVLHFQIQA